MGNSELDTLPARERQILLLRYGLAGQPPLTQLETAGLLGISRSYVSRLETRWNCCGRRGVKTARFLLLQNFQLQLVQLFKSI